MSSAYVPTGSMPAGVRSFAEYQPFTPIIQTLRGLLAGTAGGHDLVLAIGWCVAIAAASYLWARRRYNRTAFRPA